MEFVVAIHMGREALMMTLMLASPILLATLVIGLVVGVLQAVTHVQEQTLTFVPKIIVALAVIMILLPWMMRVLVEYSSGLVRDIPYLIS